MQAPALVSVLEEAMTPLAHGPPPTVLMRTEQSMKMGKEQWP